MEWLHGCLSHQVVLTKLFKMAECSPCIVLIPDAQPATKMHKSNQT